MMREAVIVAAARTPIGRCRGVLAPVPAHILGALAVKEAVRRAGIAAESIDDVIFANLMNHEINNMGRMVALEAGLPITVPGITLDRQCAASLNALAYGAIQIMAGFADVIVAGGVESDSRRTWMLEKTDTAYAVQPPRFVDIHTAPDSLGNPPMGITAENIAEKYDFSRRQLDAFALRSHQRASAAWQAGCYDEQIVPVTVMDRKGRATGVSRDESVRPDCSLETLATLRPSFRPDGVVTAGNSSPMSDGAGALVVMERRLAERTGREILGVFRGYAAAGVDPNYMGLGPVPATAKLLQQTGLSVNDIDLWELNEAFAAQSLACMLEIGMDPDRVNPNGGAIAMGHPLAGTGAILAAKAVYDMRRRHLDNAVITFCVGGGQGVAVLLTRE
ncbi:thiolase family protein [Gibbsiella quercinecans]|uniref:Acetyl-CoA acetyltransferase n=1 Tax=Gibbsiella quercinecans TaxID=929813 RepID=A0A250B4L4_9GAMM|nr:thiolase family protein [Gibbsiella quercinecans]ATA21077.1 acetyl-CoA acetyltransferase [Gibbsiella quercinecans]RLM08448.1 acetyl-CoA acetyltransferase [Gibbsiella quercinecans]RLM11723.1 acetyl-CoA acetyltransferase [Gibbsiella quercinecans]